MQARGATLAPGILFDSDMGRNIDAALALSMLYGLGRGRVIGVAVSSSSLEAAAFCDVIARFHNAGGALPFGLSEDGPKLDDSPMVREPLAMRNSDGQPVFRPAVRTILDTADPPVLFRNALLTQQDKQAIAVVAGPATNLARLLALSRAREIVAAKVQLLVMAAGGFDSTATTDPRIRADVVSARKVLADWPSPIIAVGMEAASAVPFPDQAIESELATTPNHPVVAAYRAFRGKQPAGASIPVQAVLAALVAATSNAEYLKLSRPGRIEVSEDGRTVFKESPAGTHRYLVIEPAEKERITEAFVKMSAVRPAAGGRGGAR